MSVLAWSASTRVGGAIVVVACAALLAGCFKRKPEEIGVTLAAGGPSSSGLTIEVDRPVHWISIHRCNPASADCNKRTTTNGHCSYDAAVPVWETAMGAHLTGRFDGVLRGAPEITGPISYGKLPAHAGWQSPATALVDGEHYTINTYVYEACDEADASCVHTKAAGCRFFTIEEGAPVEEPPS